MENLEKSAIGRKRQLRIPFTAEKILTLGLTTAKTKSLRRYLVLPETRFIDELFNYCKKHKEYNLKEPRPRLRKEITSDFAEEQAIKIDSGLKFLSIAKDADPIIKPILLYYSAINIISVFTHSLFQWEKDGKSHGIDCKSEPDVEKSVIEIRNKGLFPRLAATCTIITGDPNCFSSLATFIERLDPNKTSIEVLKRFGNEEVYEPIKSLSMDNLMNFDFKSETDKVKHHFGMHKYSGVPANMFLVDILILFTACSIARYNVIGWQKILEGKEYSYILKFEEVFERYQIYIVDLVLKLIEDPFTRFNSQVNEILESPYALK